MVTWLVCFLGEAETAKYVNVFAGTPLETYACSVQTVRYTVLECEVCEGEPRRGPHSEDQELHVEGSVQHAMSDTTAQRGGSQV